MNAQLLERIKSSASLPSLPVIALRTLELARKEDVTIDELAELISHDPALSSKILKTANSPLYAASEPVSTLSRALIVLGLQAVKTLAVSFSLIPTLKKVPANAGDAFDYMQLWKRSIYAGVAARILAKKLRIRHEEEAFLAGLLAHIGILAMQRVLRRDFDVVYAQSGGNHNALLQLLRQKFDLVHPEVGDALCTQWQLPPVLRAPIAHHHDPASETDAALKPLVEVIHVACVVGDLFASASPAQYIMRARNELLTRFNFSPADIETTLAEIGAKTGEAAQLFELDIGEDRTYSDILEEAQQTLILLSLQSEQQVRAVKKENQALYHQATTDALTGLANRARFNDFFAEQFARANRLAKPLACLFIDVDHFKKFNDTHGHQAGDEVLRRVGKVLKLAARNIDLAARYGGEEFALILTETDANTAAQLAEEIRTALANEKVIFQGKLLKITASIGVAGIDRAGAYQSASQLTAAADKAVYAAKAAGRNCVRLFRPSLARSEVRLAK
ncbi:MAG TPA: GGDEF domain-containing protein [Phycisphaerae bacterium]|nr:GGDEF domain-containing protein [Phycisphaerae bacterium]